jgi:phage terminase large subunit GpA-like protein
MLEAAQDWWKIWTPPPTLTVSQWADRERRLSAEASSEPGRWDTRRAEYQRAVMDAVSDPAVHTVVVMSSAQVGKTEILLNTIGFFVDQDPSPILVVQPSLEMAEAFSKDRLATMLRDSPCLQSKVRDPRARDSGNTLRHKTFEGGHITLSGANSPASLASRPIRVVLCDEVDRYDDSAGAEGDPVSLAVKRTTTFWNRKIILTSTPTIKGESRIEKAYLESDRRKCFVPCADCGHKQTLRWEQVRWDKTESGAHRPETAHYVCEECGSIWSDVARWSAIRKCSWQASADFNGVAGFHLSELYSPWRRLSEVAADFLEKRHDPARMQTFVNTSLGETWEEQGEKVDGAKLIERGESYDAETLPPAVVALTAGVDVQDDRLEVQVIGWGAKEEAWATRYEVLHGDPAQQRVWDDLDGLLLEQYRREDGQALRIRATCIDTGGHHGEAVYRFTKSRRNRRVFATKGAAGPRPVWPKRSSRAGLKGESQVFIIGVDTAKDAIYGRLKIAKPGPGYIHFPAADDFDQTYFDQLTSEMVTTRYREGRPYRVWVLQQGKRNEALDTFVYALAALKSLPLRLDKLRHAEDTPGDETAPAPIERRQTAQKFIPDLPKSPSVPVLQPADKRPTKAPILRRSSSWL